jgi:hypothetical protein
VGFLLGESDALLLFRAKALKGLKAIIMVVSFGLVKGWHCITSLAKARHRDSTPSTRVPCFVLA